MNDTPSVSLMSRGPEQTRYLGSRLGKMARAGDVFLLTGELGAGKTCLTQGIAEGLDVPECVRSPTFIIAREYTGRLPLYHIDFYRPGSVEEIEILGIDVYLYGRGVTVIEWADRAPGLTPLENLSVTIGHVSEVDRRLTFMAKGERYLQLETELMAVLLEDTKWNWV